MDKLPTWNLTWRNFGQASTLGLIVASDVEISPRCDIEGSKLEKVHDAEIIYRDLEQLVHPFCSVVSLLQRNFASTTCQMSHLL